MGQRYQKSEKIRENKQQEKREENSMHLVTVSFISTNRLVASQLNQPKQQTSQCQIKNFFLVCRLFF